MLILLKQDKIFQSIITEKSAQLLWLYHRVVLMKYKQKVLVNNLGGRIQQETDSVLMRWYHLDGNSVKIPGQGPQQLRHDLGKIFLFHIIQYSLFFKKHSIGVQLIYKVVLVSGVQQSKPVIHIHISTPLLRFFSHIGHYWALSRIPCAIHQAPISYLFYI